MSAYQEEYDDAMLDFSRADYESAAGKLAAILERDPGHFEAQLALGMAFCRKGDLGRAIVEGHKAEKLRPREQLVHTNLSLFYMKAGNRAVAEHHGLQARIASWHSDAAAPDPRSGDPELGMARPKPEPVKFSGPPPDMPWKKKPPAHS